MSTSDNTDTFSPLLTIGFKPNEHEINEADALRFKSGLNSNASKADIEAYV